jgi:hypothetical protein
MLRDTFSDAYNKRDFGFDCVNYSFSSERGRDVDNAGIGLEGIDSVLYGVEDRQSKMSGSTLLRSDSTDHLGSIGQSVLGVESALLSSEALADDASVLVDPHMCGLGHGPHGARERVGGEGEGGGQHGGRGGRDVGRWNKNLFPRSLTTALQLHCSTRGCAAHYVYVYTLYVYMCI